MFCIIYLHVSYIGEPETKLSQLLSLCLTVSNARRPGFCFSQGKDNQFVEYKTFFFALYIVVERDGGEGRGVGVGVVGCGKIRRRSSAEMVVSEQGWGWHVGRTLIRPFLPIDTLCFSYIFCLHILLRMRS